MQPLKQKGYLLAVAEPDPGIQSMSLRLFFLLSVFELCFLPGGGPVLPLQKDLLHAAVGNARCGPRLILSSLRMTSKRKPPGIPMIESLESNA